MRVVRGFGILLVGALPILFVWIGRTYRARVYAELHHHWESEHVASLESFALAIMATAVLCFLYWYVKKHKPGRAFFVAGGLSCVVMLGFAVFTEPDDNDAFIYVGYGVMQHFEDAYHPPDKLFAPAFAEVNHRWPSPLVACVYGPLWLATDRAILTGTHSMSDGLLRVKLFAASVFLLLLWLLYGMTKSSALLAVVGLNPALINEFIERAHNDLLAVVCCLLAVVVLARRWVPFAFALVVAAGMIKIIFIVAGAVVFARWGSLWQRIAMIGSTAAAVYVGSLFLGGHAYFQAMHDVAVVNLHNFLAPSVIRLTYTHAATIVVALVAIGFALLRNRWRASAAWAFGSLSSAHLSWYLSWGIPYVALAPASWATAAFFISWPLAESVIEAPFGRVNSALYLGLATIAPIVDLLCQQLKRSRNRTSASSPIADGVVVRVPALLGRVTSVDESSGRWNRR